MGTLHSDFDSSSNLQQLQQKNLSYYHMQNYELTKSKSKKKKKRKSLQNRLNKTGPDIGTCRTPDGICLKLLLALFIRAHCFLFTRYE